MAAVLKTLSVHGVDIPVIFEEDHYLPMVSMQLVFDESGSMADTIAGEAKMAARLLGEGTRRDGAIAFAQKLESQAITLSAYAGRESLVVMLSALKEAFDYGTQLAAELFADPNVTPEAFATVQQRMLGSVHQKESNLDHIASLTLKSILFQDTPRERPADGTPETLARLTRDDLDRFLSRHLGLGNATVVIGGDLSWDDAARWIERMLQPLSSHDLDALPFCATNPSGTLLREVRPGDQAYIYFGAPFEVPYDGDETHLAKVAGFVLGSSGFGSRLMEEIRVKRGLAYSAYGRFALERTAHYFTGHLQTKLESETEAIEVVREVVSTFVHKGITAEELEAAKQFLLGSEPLRTETLSRRLARAYHEYYSRQPLGSGQQELQRIETLTLETINAFIREHDEIEALSFGIVGA